MLGNFFSSLVFGYPIAYLLAFKASTNPSYHTYIIIISLYILDVGLGGIWTGMSAAWLSAGSIYAVILYRTDWQDECDKAAERNAAGTQSMKSPQKQRRDVGKVSEMDSNEEDSTALTSLDVDIVDEDDDLEDAKPAMSIENN